MATSKQIGKTLVRSSASIGPRNFYGDDGSSIPVPTESTNVERQFGSTNVSVNFKGHNGRVDGILAPDINWTGNYTFDTQTKGIIEVKANITGKGFPAFQEFIEDSNGKKIMLNTFAPPSKNAIFNLLTSPDVNHGTNYMKIGVDNHGNFNGTLMVYERGTYKGSFWDGLFSEKAYKQTAYRWNKYTIDEWNKKQTNKPAAGSNSN